ncbi:MAG: tryptophan--tRNA ligase [Anaerolineae bacterium]
MAKKGTILTGHRTSGRRHIGHLVGTLRNWAKLQDDYDCFFLIADWHALTTDPEHTDRIEETAEQMMYDWLAAGIDPERSTIVMQSMVPEHAELALLFGMLVTVARLERNPTYKEQVQELGLKERASAGLLLYPVLQAADILIYKADAVPVGEDQAPHIELSREIARRFNRVYGDTFPEPQVLLSEAPRLPGIDSRTMHASRGNTIPLSSSADEVRELVMQMYTDPTRIHPTDPGHVEGNPVFTYHDLFNPDADQVAEFKERYRKGTIGDVEVKKVLADVLVEELRPFRKIRAERSAQEIREIVEVGSSAAREVAKATMAEVRRAMSKPYLA